MDKVNALLFKDLETAQNFDNKLQELRIQGGEKGARAANDYYYKIRSEGALQKSDYVKILSIHDTWLGVEQAMPPNVDTSKYPLFSKKHGYINTNDLKK